MKASVIIPTCNRAGQLETTLSSLMQLNFEPSEFEIIVIDNGSTDATKDVTLQFIELNNQHSIKYVFDAMPGLLTGRHRGALEARSEILVFIDDDIIADKDWLTAITDTFMRLPEAHLVGGKCLPHYEKEPPNWLKYFWSDLSDGNKMLTDLSLCDYGDAEKEVHPTWIWGLNFSIRKNTLYECGGFHPDNLPAAFQHFQGDGETGLSFKLHQAGLKAFYNPKAMVLHQVPAERMTLAYFDKRYFYQGVCNSYTAIRTNKGLLPGVKKIYADNIRPYLGKMYRLLKPDNELSEKKLTLAEIKEREMLFCRFYTMKNAGYEFHQQMAKKSPLVLSWILKENYFDYKLPV